MIFVLIGVSAHPAWLGLVLGCTARLLAAASSRSRATARCSVRRRPAAGRRSGCSTWCFPWFTFSLLYAALYARMIRANVLETLDEEYVRTARAKGAGEAPVLRGHVLRNAMLPIVTMLGMDIGTALGGVIFIEPCSACRVSAGCCAARSPRRDLPVDPRRRHVHDDRHPAAEPDRRHRLRVHRPARPLARRMDEPGAHAASARRRAATVGEPATVDVLAKRPRSAASRSAGTFHTPSTTIDFGSSSSRPRRGRRT